MEQMTRFELYQKLEELIDDDKLDEVQAMLMEYPSSERAAIVTFAGDRGWNIIHHVRSSKESLWA